MIICPVCEHPQAGGVECEQCGRTLRSVQPAETPVPRLEELERTAIASPKLQAPATRLEELEGTRLAPVPEVPVAALADIDVTRVSVGEVPVEAVLGLDRGRAVEVGGKTPVTQGPPACRYCRHVQAKGPFCDRCGMRLPTVRGAPAVTGPVTGRGAEALATRCRACGAPGVGGERCRDCGRLLPVPEP